MHNWVIDRHARLGRGGISYRPHRPPRHGAPGSTASSEIAGKNAVRELRGLAVRAVTCVRNDDRAAKVPIVKAGPCDNLAPPPPVHPVRDPVQPYGPNGNSGGGLADKLFTCWISGFAPPIGLDRAHCLRTGGWRATRERAVEPMSVLGPGAK